MTFVDALSIDLAGAGIETFWIRSGTDSVGLVRLFDLDDIPEGSPRFDLRIAEGHRGLGIGTQAVDWLTRRLFSDHAALHRVEATTRADNFAMQRVLKRCGYRLEGRFVEAWTNEDGSRSDALSFAILRREFDR